MPLICPSETRMRQVDQTLAALLLIAPHSRSSRIGKFLLVIYVRAITSARFARCSREIVVERSKTWSVGQSVSAPAQAFGAIQSSFRIPASIRFETSQCHKSLELVRSPYEASLEGSPACMASIASLVITIRPASAGPPR
jgi:hypothetical protein